MFAHPSTWAANTSQWKPRAIYQTMTDRFARTDGSTTAHCVSSERIYCGGTWRGMINQLDYIQGMGFDAVMISPVIKNVEGRVEYGEAYHGYWPIDLYELNPHFGTEQDLLDLSAAVHKRGMFLMMDTIINNMAYITNGSDPATSIDYSVFKPFNSESYFHKYCKITNWLDPQNYQTCQTGDNIVPLPDLFTEHDEVQQTLIKWAQDMIAKYSIDGLRIDAAKHVNTGFLYNFGKALGDTFMTGEVYDSSVDMICDYKNHYITSVPNFPIFYAVIDVFTQSKMEELPNAIEVMKHSCQDTNGLTLFTESHDVSRFANRTDDIVLAKNVVTFNILFDGIPIIYQGQEQHFHGSYEDQNSNREAVWLSGYNRDAVLYKHIRTMNRIRKHAYNLDPDWFNMQTIPIYQGESELAFRKGIEGRQMVMVLSAQGTKQTGQYDLALPVSYNPGVVAMDVISCVNYTANDVGQITINMKTADPQVLFPADLMAGSGLCGYSESNISYVELKTGRKSPTVSSPSAGVAVAPVRSMSVTILFSLLMSIAIAVLS
ncbi:alpha-amylase [Aspergillus clavatus NRRL 1]|uniref:alpha-amylase n=1 Tax=Aspergillus clavatus (strain ATCC 1007 / CBS 513.65 / DSM 816 / NCTC 3887 / NRRL 1 / QM 1276 / 107) TaxID=344612 RepID=A1CCW9_ASPCL|nr:alpha-amylase, putative [Aspergillus clavatus NRRL 1]EAW12376.1 alpha-amylase, putative [Aspergillus clavatus NRRL 1]